MSFLLNKITKAYKKKQPFVVYRKPHLGLVKGFFQKNDTLFFVENFKESGFVFAPFDCTKKAVLIPENQSESIEGIPHFLDNFKHEETISDNSFVVDILCFFLSSIIFFAIFLDLISSPY